jgi:hypothetical protein
MNPDWQQVLRRLRDYPPSIHKLLPPCPQERLQIVQTALGKMPDALADMLEHFNGAELFQRNGPLVTLFGISTVPQLSAIEWAADWYVDRFTPEWRAAGLNGQADWAVGMMNYGGLILLHEDGLIKEWDTSEGIWLVKQLPFREWIEKVMKEGELIIADASSP